MDNQKYMEIALSLAKKAELNGDIPVGAVVIDENGNVLGKGYNKKEKDKDPIRHAEMIAISNASKKIGSWRLENCIIYSTLEPCLMCLGAILESRINLVVFGLTSEKFGSVRILDKLKDTKDFNHSINYTYDLTLSSRKTSREMLQSFFNKLRNQNDII
ncbi:MAG: nucleoside deaminase [Spiroplasma sp.]|nr:nucleoside deaminase [Spiroplasma sp.]